MHELSQLKRAVGSTYSFDTIHLADDDLSDTTSPEHHEVEHMDVQQIHDSLYQHSKEGTINVDDIIVSAVHAGRHQGVKPPHLAKLCHIGENTAKQTLDITSQKSVRTDNPKLSRNYGTNDWILRYKHLKEHFFMDTLFATSKAKRFSRGHTCAQLFVTDKGFVYIVPMKSESQVLQAVKQFAKAICAPDALICDSAKAQTSSAVR